jgi:hypothetical protein
MKFPKGQGLGHKLINITAEATKNCKHIEAKYPQDIVVLCSRVFCFDMAAILLSFGFEANLSRAASKALEI